MIQHILEAFWQFQEAFRFFVADHHSTSISASVIPCSASLSCPQRFLQIFMSHPSSKRSNLIECRTITNWHLVQRILIFITIQDSTLIWDKYRCFLSNSFHWSYWQVLESPRLNPSSILPERHVCFELVLLWFSLLILTFQMLCILHAMMNLWLIDLKTMEANKLIRVRWNYTSLFSL